MDSHLTVLRDLDEVKIADSVACDVEELSKYLPACNSIFNIVTQNIVASIIFLLTSENHYARRLL